MSNENCPLSSCGFVLPVRAGAAQKTIVPDPGTASERRGIFYAMAVSALLVAAAHAQDFNFSTGAPDGRMASGSRPASAGKIEIETGDDFLLPNSATINQATFTGLLPTGASLSDISQVRVEIYRVFPNDSTTPPDGHVPTRVNSPSDNAFETRDSVASTLSFSASVLNSSFSAANSVLNGIHPLPGSMTGGDGSVRGQEVQFHVTFNDPLGLAADHYFFVPQVELTTGDFLWLSAPKPITGIGTTPFSPDLQTWIRDGNLDPDWLRIGTDIVGGNPAPTFNASFTLSGTLPDNVSTLGVLGFTLLLLAGCARHLQAVKQRSVQPIRSKRSV